ncbi:putative formin, FH2 domain-containing protein [Helianthus annuus]|nr:putative formin, FH2 domain-containing protein [Helianthus annuus]
MFDQSIVWFAKFPLLETSRIVHRIDETQNRFDEELIESLFSYNQHNTNYNQHNTNEELKNKSPSLGKHILEPKRLQNLTILFKALNATPEQVCCALVRGKNPINSP